MTKNDERVGTERGLGRNFHCYPTGEGEWFFFLQRRLQHNVSHHQRRQLYLHLMTRKIAQKELLIVVVCCHLTSSPGLGPCMIVLPPRVIPALNLSSVYCSPLADFLWFFSSTLRLLQQHSLRGGKFAMRGRKKSALEFFIRWIKFSRLLLTWNSFLSARRVFSTCQHKVFLVSWMGDFSHFSHTTIFGTLLSHSLEHSSWILEIFHFPFVL